MSEASMGILVFLGFLVLLVLLVMLGVAANVWWISRQQARRAEREVELKREMLDRGLSVDEIERLFRATAEQPKQPRSVDEENEIVGEFGGLLGTCQPSTIEEVLMLFQIADWTTRRAMVSAVTEMRAQSETGKITDEQICAVVRGLARLSRSSVESATQTNDLPSLTGSAPRVADAIRLSDRPGV
jgi:hypothetical protein